MIDSADEDLIESLLHFFSSGTGGTLDAEDQPERISEKCYRRIKHQPERHQGRYPHSSALPVNAPIQISEVFSNLISNTIKQRNRKKSVEIGFDNIGWPILDLELDDSRDKNFLRPRIRLIKIKNQKFQNRRASCLLCASNGIGIHENT